MKTRPYVALLRCSLCPYFALVFLEGEWIEAKRQGWRRLSAGVIICPICREP